MKKILIALLSFFVFSSAYAIDAPKNIVLDKA
jgi:hypothetical protein